MNNNPLVSIIVRTKDRPKLLVRALKSIASQTYRPIEVVLVNDGGCDLDIGEIRQTLGDVSVNYIRLETNTGRAHAGNVGIENAKGQYIGFLDDDDEFYPEHVETLVSFLKQSDYKVAYTGVEFVENIFEADSMDFRREKKWVFRKDFSYEDLLIANYIPLISLLFEKDLLKKVKIDESFDLYEDWDMLIKMAYEYKFFFIDKITAVYNNGGGGQVAFNASSDIEKKAVLKVYSKHLNKINAEIIFSLCEAARKKDEVIVQEKRHIDELSEQNTILMQQNQNFNKLLHDRDMYINAVHSSRGWRCLRRYYRFRDRFFRRAIS